jgi:hypothetical protein
MLLTFQGLHTHNFVRWNMKIVNKNPFLLLSHLNVSFSFTLICSEKTKQQLLQLKELCNYHSVILFTYSFLLKMYFHNFLKWHSSSSMRVPVSFSWSAKFWDEIWVLFWLHPENDNLIRFSCIIHIDIFTLLCMLVEESLKIIGLCH